MGKYIGQRNSKGGTVPIFVSTKMGLSPLADCIAGSVPYDIKIWTVPARIQRGFMGIRFYCPNGHKLNVKVFQAGRKGICPYCGAKFFIPNQSTRKSSKEERSALRALAAASASHSHSPNSSTIPPPTNFPNSEQSIPTGLETNPFAGPKSSFTPAIPSDPFIEAGDAVWYVRPPSGGQYGPATGPIMRRWLGEGRITSDTLVWREGWRDWQDASAIFPQLHVTKPLSDLTNYDDPYTQSDAPLVLQTPNRQNHRNIRTLIISLIILAGIVLTGLVIWVFTK
jgi:hypothetical protein